MYNEKQPTLGVALFRPPPRPASLAASIRPAGNGVHLLPTPRWQRRPFAPNPPLATASLCSPKPPLATASTRSPPVSRSLTHSIACAHFIACSLHVLLTLLLAHSISCSLYFLLTPFLAHSVLCSAPSFCSAPLRTRSAQPLSLKHRNPHMSNSKRREKSARARDQQRSHKLLSSARATVSREQRLTSHRGAAAGGGCGGPTERRPHKGWRHEYKQQVRATAPDRKAKALVNFGAQDTGGGGGGGGGRPACSKMSAWALQGDLRTKGKSVRTASGTTSELRQRYDDDEEGGKDGSDSGAGGGGRGGSTGVLRGVWQTGNGLAAASSGSCDTRNGGARNGGARGGGGGGRSADVQSKGDGDGGAGGGGSGAVRGAWQSGSSLAASSGSRDTRNGGSRGGSRGSGGASNGNPVKTNRRAPAPHKAGNSRIGSGAWPGLRSGGAPSSVSSSSSASSSSTILSSSSPAYNPAPAATRAWASPLL